MKKIISAFLILQLVFVSFTFSGCHKNTTLNDSRCLKYYTYCEDSICDLINKYNKYCTVNYNDTYKIEIIKFDSEEEMKLKMSTEIMAGEGPDIFSLSQKLPFEKLTDSKTIADVNELISEFSYDIGIDNCDSKIMDAGVIDGKRYFIPLFYSPDVFITTEETLNKYNLTSSEFSFKALSEELSKNKKEYSLFGSADDNIAFFIRF